MQIHAKYNYKNRHHEMRFSIILDTIGPIVSIGQPKQKTVQYHKPLNSSDNMIIMFYA